MVCSASVGVDVSQKGTWSWQAQSRVFNIFAFGHDNGMDDRPPTAESTNEVGCGGVQESQNTLAAHNFPVYVKGLSECSNGASLIHREP